MSHARHIVSIAWLALALLLGQQAAALHDIANGAQFHWQKHDGKRGPIHCDENFACAAFGGTIGPSVAVLPVVLAENVAPPAALVLAAPAPALLAYRSQAPPAFLP